MSETQLDLIPPHVFESEFHKYIRYFVQNNRLPDAERVFRRELLGFLRIASGNFQDRRIRELTAFGREVLGEKRTNEFIRDCMDEVVAEIEAAA